MRRPESSASMSVRSDSMGWSALRIAVIGAHTAEPESARPYTVYRTVATYEGQCFERLIRYSEFQWFHKKLKFKNKTTVSKTFPKKKWTRKASLEDDVIEARQVMLNEFMREVSRSELTPESEQCLFKLLKMGKYEDGSGRVSDLRGSLQASFLKSDRGDRSARRRGPLGVVHEEGDEEGDKAKPNGTELAAAATLTATTVAFPAISSNATTVLTEEERSAVGSQPRFRADSEIAMLAAPDSAASDNSVHHGNGHEPQSNSRSAPHKSQSSSIPASAYSEMVLNRPQLKTAQSLPPGRRGKRVDFPAETHAAPPASAPAALDTSVAPVDERPELDGRLSPEAKYRERINTHLGTISRLLSESETETEDMESARSIQPLLPMPLTA